MFQIAADMLSKPAALQVLLMLGLIIGVYILLVRPQLQRLAAHGAFVASLAPGDRVTTGGGLVARIVSCDGPLLTVALADGVHVVALTSSVEKFPQELGPFKPMPAGDRIS